MREILFGKKYGIGKIGLGTIEYRQYFREEKVRYASCTRPTYVGMYI
jgi:hypothetical protein